ncbi:hypothetical protein NQ317_007848 [Molorchus minor]|uniref:THAP-type domain-containing protein n=1 Tax=Molorchus minor TaxID=1323400 RepID=A0ABQ9JT80_9CUCU|nr:hypothetical protein NQ317_007848 [Molorchus minor]
MSKRKSNYKTCIVPECKNTSTTTPDKLFISLPSDQKIRREWQRAMHRSDYVSDKGSRYCCADHFNVEEDIENYMYIKLMKTGKIRIKSGVVPHIFDCQDDGTVTRRSEPGETLIKGIKEDVTEQESKLESVQEVSRTTVDRGIQVMLRPHTRSKLSQAMLRPYMRSKGSQCS